MNYLSCKEKTFLRKSSQFFSRFIAKLVCQIWINCMHSPTSLHNTLCSKITQFRYNWKMKTEHEFTMCMLSNLFACNYATLRGLCKHSFKKSISFQTCRKVWAKLQKVTFPHVFERLFKANQFSQCFNKNFFSNSAIYLLKCNFTCISWIWIKQSFASILVLGQFNIVQADPSWDLNTAKSCMLPPLRLSNAREQ